MIDRNDEPKRLTPENIETARALYGDWFASYPDIKNPTDINRPEKFYFMSRLEWHEAWLMISTRKQGFDFSKAEFWQPQGEEVSHG
ncbi:hypothetical protein OAF82_00585 [bacterium]|nr:hypothetical protein [bacterium]